MKKPAPSFVEVCVYQVDPEKAIEFESLVARVCDHHKSFPGAIDVRYMKRTHRPGSFASAKRGEPPLRLTRAQRALTYVLYWELETPIAHGRATRSGLSLFFKEFRRCLLSPPKILLGERIV